MTPTCQQAILHHFMTSRCEFFFLLFFRRAVELCVYSVHTQIGLFDYYVQMMMIFVTYYPGGKT